MTSYINCNTINSNTPTVISLKSISHIVQNKMISGQSTGTTWINLHSGKSIHVDFPYEKAYELFSKFLDQENKS